MYRNITPGIKKFYLEPSLHKLHKEGVEKSDFGLDNSRELIDGGVGLYSSADMKKNIGPVITEYYRIGLLRNGEISFNIGLESFRPQRNWMVFGFPGQIFSLRDKTEDFFCYYLLFSEKFISESLLHTGSKNNYPFLTYSGVQCFALTEDDANEAEQIILKINEEIKNRKPGMSDAIKLYIQLLLILASRCYVQKAIHKQQGSDTASVLFSRFIKLVNANFHNKHRVSDYAEMLYVSSDYLNRVVKSKSGKTAHELIDEMILTEAKAHLLYSQLSIAEIACRLDFTDPSHFTKFFRKYARCTPADYRSKSE